MKPRLVSLFAALLLTACHSPEVANPQPAPTPAPIAAVAPAPAPTNHDDHIDVAKINEPFRHVADVAGWVEKFEQDHREICAQRVAIANAIGLKPGMSIADVGSGTGLFEPLFSTLVGPAGRVFALDISPEFVAHVRQRALLESLTNVDVQQCPDDATGLPPASVDVVFVCDVYHHFEHPERNLSSIHATLKPDGRFVVVDFDKIEGKSSDFILHHVRATKDEVVKELSAAGFTLDRSEPILTENYFLVFRRAPAR